MSAELDHARIVAALSATHERRLLDILQQLESRIAAYVITAPSSNAALFDLVWAVTARSDIETIMRETYLTEVDSIVRQYPDILESLYEVFAEVEGFTGVAPEVIANLQRISFQGFQDIAVTFSNRLSTELYQNTLTGRSVAESVENLRKEINGVYIQSDQAEVQRLVAIANAGGDDAEEAIRELHQIYAADRRGNNMRRYAKQMVHDSLMQFDASVTYQAGKDAGADKWKYQGTQVEDSRDFCVRNIDRVFTEDEINTIWSTEAWEGKAAGDPFIVRGGYNCRHHFFPVFDA